MWTTLISGPYVAAIAAYTLDAKAKLAARPLRLDDTHNRLCPFSYGSAGASLPNLTSENVLAYRVQLRSTGSAGASLPNLILQVIGHF